jgi:hypothetical protein
MKLHEPIYTLFVNMKMIYIGEVRPYASIPPKGMLLLQLADLFQDVFIALDY